MNWPARLLICGIIVVPCLFVSRGHPGAHATEPVVPIQQFPSQSSFANSVDLPGDPPVTTDSGQANTPDSSGPPPGTGAEPSANPYQAIAERNMFALQPAPAPPTPTVSEPPPKKDLYLTGLCDLNSAHSAVFRMAEAGQPPICFALAEGEQNDWLEVLSVASVDRTVKIRLKQPMVRIRAVGVEVILTLETFH